MRHEMHLAARGLGALGAVAVLAAGVGFAVAGGLGAASAAVAAVVVSGNHLVAAASTGWARTLRPGVLAVGYGVFVVRMLLVFASLAALAGVPWIHRGVFAGTFCATLAATLVAECLSYARNSYVPSWRVIAR